MSEQKTEREFWYITRSREHEVLWQTPVVGTGHIKATDAMTALEKVVQEYKNALGLFSATIYAHKPSHPVVLNTRFEPKKLAEYSIIDNEYVNFEDLETQI